MAALPALSPNRVAVAGVIADFIKSLAAHGLRLTAQIKLAAAEITAAIASSMAELSKSMDHLRFAEDDPCSCIVPSRKAGSET